LQSAKAATRLVPEWFPRFLLKWQNRPLSFASGVFFLISALSSAESDISEERPELVEGRPADIELTIKCHSGVLSLSKDDRI